MLLTLLLSLTVSPLQGVTPLGTAVQEATPSLPRQIATFEGDQGAAQLGLFDAASGAFTGERLSTDLSDWDSLAVVPIDFTGRAELRASLAGSPRLRVDVGQGARIELANGLGTLFKVRATRQGSLVYAYVHVPASGVPRRLIERPALTGISDPFLDRIAIDAEGTAILVATSFAGGGDLFEVNLASGVVDSRTEGVPPVAFAPDGLWLQSGWGFGVSPAGVHRFVRRPGAASGLVPVVGAAPSVWRGDAATSPAGTFAVTIAGQGPDGWIPYVFGAFGPARPVAQVGSRISPVGYLPESTFGPFLGVSDDGVSAAWCLEVPAVEPFRDVMVGRADLIAAPVAASGDAVVVDTLDEVGRIIPSPAGDFLFAVGEPNDPTEGGLEAADVYSARIDPAGTFTARNLSRTSASVAAPFDPGTWVPARMTLVTPSTALVHDDDAKRLLAFDINTGQWAVVLLEVREVAWIETSDASGGWVAAVERDDAQRNWQIIASATPGGPAQVVDPGSPTAEYRTPTAFRGRAASVGAVPGAVAYIRREGTLEFLDVVELPTLQRIRWSPSVSTFAPPLSFLGPRTLLFTRQAGPALGEQRVWSFRGAPADRALLAPPRPSLLFR